MNNDGCVFFIYDSEYSCELLWAWTSPWHHICRWLYLLTISWAHYVLVTHDLWPHGLFGLSIFIKSFFDRFMSWNITKPKICFGHQKPLLNYIHEHLNGYLQMSCFHCLRKIKSRNTTKWRYSWLFSAYIIWNWHICL